MCWSRFWLCPSSTLSPFLDLFVLFLFRCREDVEFIPWTSGRLIACNFYPIFLHISLSPTPPSLFHPLTFSPPHAYPDRDIAMKRCWGGRGSGNQACISQSPPPTTLQHINISLSQSQLQTQHNLSTTQVQHKHNTHANSNTSTTQTQTRTQIQRKYQYKHNKNTSTSTSTGTSTSTSTSTNKTQTKQTKQSRTLTQTRAFI